MTCLSCVVPGYLLPCTLPGAPLWHELLAVTDPAVQEYRFQIAVKCNADTHHEGLCVSSAENRWDRQATSISETLRIAASGPTARFCALALPSENQIDEDITTPGWEQPWRQVKHGDTLAGPGKVKLKISSPSLGGDTGSFKLMYQYRVATSSCCLA